MSWAAATAPPPRNGTADRAASSRAGEHAPAQHDHIEHHKAVEIGFLRFARPDHHREAVEELDPVVEERRQAQEGSQRRRRQAEEGRQDQAQAPFADLGPEEGQDRHQQAAEDHAEREKVSRLLVEPARDVVQVRFVLRVDLAPGFRRRPAEEVLAPANLLARHVERAEAGDRDPGIEPARHTRPRQCGQGGQRDDEGRQHHGGLPQLHDAGILVVEDTVVDRRAGVRAPDQGRQESQGQPQPPCAVELVAVRRRRDRMNLVGQSHAGISADAVFSLL